MDAGVPEGGAAGDYAGHRVRRADRVYHERGRFRHLLFYRRVQDFHAGDGGLRHDEKAYQPQDQRRIIPVVCYCSDAPGGRKRPGSEAAAKIMSTFGGNTQK